MKPVLVLVAVALWFAGIFLVNLTAESGAPSGDAVLGAALMLFSLGGTVWLFRDGRKEGRQSAGGEAAPVRNRGVGELYAHNGTRSDAHVLLTTGGQSVRSGFVEAGASILIPRIPDGTYHLYVRYEGESLGRTRRPAGGRRPTRAVCFTQPFVFQSTGSQHPVFTITLHEVPGGTARTRAVPLDSIPPSLDRRRV